MNDTGKALRSRIDDLEQYVASTVVNAYPNPNSSVVSSSSSPRDAYIQFSQINDANNVRRPISHGPTLVPSFDDSNALDFMQTADGDMFGGMTSQDWSPDEHNVSSTSQNSTERETTSRADTSMTGAWDAYDNDILQDGNVDPALQSDATVPKTTEKQTPASSKRTTPSRRDSTQATPKSSSITRLEAGLAAVHAEGFDGIEDLLSEYYTADLSASPALANARRLGRNRQLPSLLAALRENAQKWREWESQGYRNETIQSAECVLALERSKLIKNKHIHALIGPENTPGDDHDSAVAASTSQFGDISDIFQDEVS